MGEGEEGEGGKKEANFFFFFFFQGNSTGGDATKLEGSRNARIKIVGRERKGEKETKKRKEEGQEGEEEREYVCLRKIAFKGGGVVNIKNKLKSFLCIFWWHGWKRTKFQPSQEKKRTS